MFTGIIEDLGNIVGIEQANENLYISVSSKLAPELKVDQSVAHNGVCLTIVNIEHDVHTVCAVPETIAKTTIGNWQINDVLNLERCMMLNARLDGHIVQGHVDAIGCCLQRVNHTESWQFTFSFAKEFAHLIVEKGSISVNGTSLTCFNVTPLSFDVAIIPYTFAHTSVSIIEENTMVNLEFDIIGKYVARINELKA
jgi:riboflavin synthase